MTATEFNNLTLGTERIAWMPADVGLPDSEQTVLIAILQGDDPVWLGFHDGEVWRAVDGAEVSLVTHWAELPNGPHQPPQKQGP